MKIIKYYKILFFLITLLVSTGFVQANKILIINSDDSVYKYQKNASEFKKTLLHNGYQWTEFNLANYAGGGENEIKKIIQQDTSPLIYCIGTKAYSFVRNITQKKKLLFSSIINWRRLNVNTNTYGIANELLPEQEMSLLRYFFPSIKKIGLLYSNQFSFEYVKTIKHEALKLGIEIISQHIDNAKEISQSLNTLLPKVDIFWVISDPVVLNSEKSVQEIFSIAHQQKKPVYAYSEVFIEHGAMLAISADIATIGRQSANLSMLINSNKLAAGTVQVPAGSTITLNKCIVDTLRFKFNQDALDSVNRLVNCRNND